MGVKGTDKMPAPPIFVAECELTLGAKELEAVLTRCGLDYVLINLWGFDGNQHYSSSGTFYEVEELTFRNRSGKVVTGKRFSGLERLDDAWINEGRPSEDAKIASRQDMS